MNKAAKISSLAMAGASVVAGSWFAASGAGVTARVHDLAVYYGSGAITVPAALSTAKYGLGSNGSVTLQSPDWSPRTESAGSVTTPGDLALVDASGATNGARVSVFVTNLAALQRDYASFVLPVGVYYLATSPDSQASPYLATPSCATGSCSWQLANGEASAPDVTSSLTYLTSGSGVVSFTLPRGYYDITMQTGGAYYCIATTPASLSPSFFISARPA
ncbi:MAG: hypothetical protein ACYC0I_07925 [Acidimicrobiales bacterium]